VFSCSPDQTTYKKEKEKKRNILADTEELDGRTEKKQPYKDDRS